MAVVSFASAKGGVGKTTLAVNVATEFAYRQISTVVLDCDQNQHATQFGDTFCLANPELPLQFVGRVNKNNILEHIRDASAAAEVVIVDLPAGSSHLAFMATCKSHLIVIPAQRTSLDAKDAARTAIQVAQAADVCQRVIPSVLIWTMIGSQFETRTEKFVRSGFQAMLTDPEQAILPASLLKLDTYPAGFVHGYVPRQVMPFAGRIGTLPSPSGPRSIHAPPSATRAAENISAVAEGILARLRDAVSGKGVAGVVVRPEILDQIMGENEPDREDAA